MTLKNVKKEDNSESMDEETFSSDNDSRNSYQEDSFVTNNDNSDEDYSETDSEKSKRHSKNVKKENFIVKDNQEDLYLINQMQDDEKQRGKRKLWKIEIPLP